MSRGTGSLYSERKSNTEREKEECRFTSVGDTRHAIVESEGEGKRKTKNKKSRKNRGKKNEERKVNRNEEERKKTDIDEPTRITASTFGCPHLPFFLHLNLCFASIENPSPPYLSFSLLCLHSLPFWLLSSLTSSLFSSSLTFLSRFLLLLRRFSIFFLRLPAFRSLHTSLLLLHTQTHTRAQARTHFFFSLSFPFLSSHFISRFLLLYGQFFVLYQVAAWNAGVLHPLRAASNRWNPLALSFAGPSMRSLGLDKINLEYSLERNAHLALSSSSSCFL